MLSMDLSGLFHDTPSCNMYFQVVPCSFCPLPNQIKLKFDQDFKGFRSFCFCHGAVRTLCWESKVCNKHFVIVCTSVSWAAILDQFLLSSLLQILARFCVDENEYWTKVGYRIKALNYIKVLNARACYVIGSWCLSFKLGQLNMWPYLSAAEPPAANFYLRNSE